MKRILAMTVLLMLAVFTAMITPSTITQKAYAQIQPVICNSLQGITFGATGFQCVPATGLAFGGTGLVQVASQQITTNGTAVGAGVTQAQPALTIAGLTTTSACWWSIPTALPATWQTGIDMELVVTANTVTPQLTNGTAGSITPVAQLVNIKCLL